MMLLARMKTCKQQLHIFILHSTNLKEKKVKRFLLQIFLEFSSLAKMTTLPSLKLIALDVSELHDHKKEIEVFYLRGGLEGKKANMV